MRLRCWLLAAMAMAGLAAAAPPAAAEPCARTLNDYPPPPGATATLICTCGPPLGGFVLDLSDLTDELAGPDAPKPYPGTLLQTIGGVAGSWTFTPGSNICIAARHAGLIADPEIGAEVRLAVSAGCDAYEGSVRNGVASKAAGPAGRSFHFPAVSGGGCPGDPGYLPERLVLGRFDSWSAVASSRSDGTWSCSVYSRAAGSAAKDGLWLLVFKDHLRFDPAVDIAAAARVTVAVDGILFPMALRNGHAFVPLSIAPVARALGTATEVAIAVRSGDAPPPTHRFPLRGFADAYARIAEECGFDPSAVLGPRP